MLSKSNYLKGLQCSKLLWYSLNDRSVFPPTSPATQHLFDEGTLIGNLARKLYDGIDCYHRSNDENIKITSELLKKKKTLFEAGLRFGEAYARADILVPVKNGWDIIEVKSGTSVKDEHIPDISFQYYVFTNAGLKINNCYIMHINNEYVRNGDVELNKLFVKEKVDVVIDGIAAKVSSMLGVGDVPKVDIGTYCDSPYTCALKDMCWKHIPKHSVFELPAKKAWELYKNGIVLVKDATGKLTPKMQIQVDAVKNGKIHIEREIIKEFFNKLEYPLHYFDFETFSSGVPMFNDVKPYQQIPFQYSLHVSGEHYSYLSLDGKDPRSELLLSLKNHIGPTGSIVAYNASFEKTRLKEMALVYPSYAKFIDSLIPRFVDLLDVFRNFKCYNPTQEGSASLKKVLPAFTGKDYSDFTIGNGGDASLAYLSVLKGLIKPESVRADLERYCGQDTEGMKWIVEKLEKVVE